MNIPALQRVVEELVEKFNTGDEITVGVLEKRCRYVLLRVGLNPKTVIRRLIMLDILEDVGKKKHCWVLVNNCMAVYESVIVSKGFDRKLLYSDEAEEC